MEIENSNRLKETGIIMITVIGVSGLSPKLAEQRFNEIVVRIKKESTIKNSVDFFEDRFYMSSDYNDVKTQVIII